MNLSIIPTASSYCMCLHCNTHCARIEDSTLEEPCYGKVEVQDEFQPGDYLHTCEGHQWIWSITYYKSYVPEGVKYP